MSALLFRSTNGQSPAVNLREALLAGQAPDRGLYFPEKFPRLSPDEIATFANLPYHEIAFRVLAKFTDGIIPNDVLATMCREAYDFSIPIEKIHDRVHLMRLDQGPTASFKDFAAQMMARMFGRFLKEDGKQLTILTATSGDTGAAVARRRERARARAWLLSLLVSGCLAVLGLGYGAALLRTFVATRGSVPATYALLVAHDAVGRAATSAFLGFLAADLAIGVLDYPGQIELVAGYAHHVVYGVALVAFLAEDVDAMFVHFALCEVPTFMLALGSVHKPWRIDLPMGIAFAATRLAFFALVVGVIAASEGPARFRPWLGGALLALHVHWFGGWLRSYGKRRTALAAGARRASKAV